MPYHTDDAEAHRFGAAEVICLSARWTSLNLTDIGTIRVQSNADWALTVGAIADASLDVEVRPAGDSFARWQSVHGQGGVYVGPQGSRDISWDIKVVGNRLVASNASKEGRVQLLFTLGQL